MIESDRLHEFTRRGVAAQMVLDAAAARVACDRRAVSQQETAIATAAAGLLGALEGISRADDRLAAIVLKVLTPEAQRLHDALAAGGWVDGQAPGMTKARDALSPHAAMLAVVDVLGWPEAARHARRRERTLRAWSEPDLPALPTIVHSAPPRRRLPLGRRRRALLGLVRRRAPAARWRRLRRRRRPCRARRHRRARIGPGDRRAAARPASRRRSRRPSRGRARNARGDRRLRRDPARSGLAGMTDALTAGGYLALRRAAAGLTLRQAARLYCYNPLGEAAAEMLLAEAERDLVILGDPALARLRGVFAFDAAIYRRLADALPPPAWCRSCGCSWDDPCDEGGQGCAWANRERTLCTACAGKAEAA